MSWEGESWYGSDSKVWGVAGVLIAIIFVVIGSAVACEAQGSSPDRPQYVKCVDQ